MTISIGNYTFQGPFNSTNPLEDRSGVYAIHCLREGKYHLIDIGESHEVKNRVENHDRISCWKRECSGRLVYSVYYTPNLQQSGRMKIEQEIRDKYNPPCGRT